MGVYDKFSNFCSNLRMSEQVVSTISYRTKQITKRVNSDFRDLNSEVQYSLFVGSYGRGTEIHTSDIDLIVQLPYSEYQKYNAYSSNGQSALLQVVRTSIANTYSTTHISGDGQVVKLNFSDGICFEIVPAFINEDLKSYTYPDTNNGGSWKVTKPRDEIKAINDANNAFNKNLKRLCRMARAWKERWQVPISGLLIDTLAYNFLKDWNHKAGSFSFYDWMSRDFFEYVKNQNSDQKYWYAPGSNQKVYRTGGFEYKALRCYNISLEAIEYESNGMPYSANQKWREIYGTKFPS
ncbi:nucleotidyltransferase domain-containing protein [Shewanella sp. UCD-KL21]|uniref:SMODS domain-containing nucleotidyltransferase n=1 Tax=Shewanella sp. UCD-KL21 TaxID=1917164 RepID=UPI000970ABCE|nr:nucleotidyltransferase domain-containing protein [Shewanella sp. UCD-KL21]